jgi:hypothetical protein
MNTAAIVTIGSVAGVAIIAGTVIGFHAIGSTASTSTQQTVVNAPAQAAPGPVVIQQVPAPPPNVVYVPGETVYPTPAPTYGSWSSESGDNTTIASTAGGTTDQNHAVMMDFLAWRASTGHSSWHPLLSSNGFTTTCSDQKGSVTLTIYDLSGTPNSPNLCAF